MSSLATQYAEVAFVLLVAGAAMVWAPLALLVAGAYFVVLAALHYRASNSAPAEPEEQQS